MTKREELNAFILRADELIDSKYILANVKIVNLLKTIASSETLIAIFKSCLTDFDYYGAKEKYFVKSALNEDKGEFVLPNSSRELLALTFSLLVDVDGGQIELGDFITKYFYENGSIYESYDAFLKMMIKPFKVTVASLMESVIAGKVQDPVEAMQNEEKKKREEKEKLDNDAKKLKEISKKAYADSINLVKKILLEDKNKIKSTTISVKEKEEILLVIDMLDSVITSGDNDAINYAYIAYKYLCKAYPFKFFGRAKAVKTEIDKIINSQEK